MALFRLKVESGRLPIALIVGVAGSLLTTSVSVAAAALHLPLFRI